MIKKLEKVEYPVPEELKKLDKDKFFSILNFIPRKEIGFLETIFEDVTSIFEKEKINVTKTELYLLIILINKIGSITDKIDFEIPNDLCIYTEKEKNQALSLLLKHVDYQNENDVLELKNTLYKSRLKNMQSNQHPTLFELFYFCPMTDLFASIGKLDVNEKEILRKYANSDYRGKFILGQYNEDLILILLKLYSVMLLSKKALFNKVKEKIEQLENKERVKNDMARPPKNRKNHSEKYNDEVSYDKLETLITSEKETNTSDNKKQETIISKRKKRDYLREYFSEYNDQVFSQGMETLSQHEKDTLSKCYGKNYDEKFDRKEVEAQISNHLAYVLRKLSLQMEKFSDTEKAKQQENNTDIVVNNSVDVAKKDVINDEIKDESNPEEHTSEKLNIDSDNMTDYLKIYNLFQELLHEDIIKMLAPTELMIILLKYEYGPHSNEEIAKFLNKDINEINSIFSKYVEELRKKAIELVNNALGNFMDFDDNIKNSYIKK